MKNPDKTRNRNPRIGICARNIFSRLTIAMLLAVSPCARAASAVVTETSGAEKPDEVNTWKLEAGPEYYYWWEGNAGKGSGNKLLDETGIRYALELSGKAVMPENWLVTVRSRVYFGRVDFNGQKTLFTSGKTSTDYYGELIDFGAGYRWVSSTGRYLDLVGRAGVE